MFDPIDYNSKTFQDIYLFTKNKKILSLKQMALHRMKLYDLRLILHRYDSSNRSVTVRAFHVPIRTLYSPPLEYATLAEP